jgi:hypothetical protein
MQKVEKMMAEGMGIPVLEFEFVEAEVSEMKTSYPLGVREFGEAHRLEFVEVRDETAFKERLEPFLFEHGICAEK